MELRRLAALRATVVGWIAQAVKQGRVRVEPMEVELPEIYAESSFLAVQTRER